MIFSGGIRLRICSGWETPLGSDGEKMGFYFVRLMIDRKTMEFLSRGLR